MALIRTVGAFKSTTLGMSAQTLMRDDMTTGHHHRRILICRLFFGYGTNKDRMEVVGWRKWYLNL